jgi:hypothetical protein
MPRYTDLDDLAINPAKNQVFEIALNLMSKSISNEMILEAFQVSVSINQSIFDALVASGKATNLYDAAAMVGKRFQPENGLTWNDLAKWVVEYDAHKERRDS